MDKLALHIESLIFVSEQAISKRELKRCLEEALEIEVENKDIESSLELIIQKYATDFSAIELTEISGGYQFLTKGAFFDTISQYVKFQNRRRLSKAALETLSIIAYKQPVTKSEMEQIRGVNCDYSVQKLLEKELVEIHGRRDAPGRPLLYSTSNKFLDYFGLKSTKEMPKLRDFKQVDNQIGEPAPIEEVEQLHESIVSEEE